MQTEGARLAEVCGPSGQGMDGRRGARRSLPVPPPADVRPAGLRTLGPDAQPQRKAHPQVPGARPPTPCSSCAQASGPLAGR